MKRHFLLSLLVAFLCSGSFFVGRSIGRRQGAQQGFQVAFKMLTGMVPELELKSGYWEHGKKFLED